MKIKIIDCPRCLGKGHVDKQDIKRLRREFYWIEGPHCAYCDGKKYVSLDFASKVNADEWFLCSDGNKEEMQKFINGDEEVISSVRQTEKHINYVGKYLMDNYINRGINKEKIIKQLSMDLKFPESEIKPFIQEMIEQIKTNILNNKE